MNETTVIILLLQRRVVVMEANSVDTDLFIHYGMINEYQFTY